MRGHDYYNEVDPAAAAWLRELIAGGHLPPGDVDTRDIRDVAPADLRGYRRCHFFAGIGGWPLALEWAEWPDDRPIWTGSCPCQPFSQAGKGAGFADERHLWPDWFWLVSECGPPTLVGEQVDGPAARAWLDLVSSDLEHAGYAVGPAVLPAACVGAPHARHRTFWVAHRNSPRRESRRETTEAVGYGGPAHPGRGAGGLADLRGPGLPERVRNGRLRSSPVGSFPREALVGSGDLERLAHGRGDGQYRRSALSGSLRPSGRTSPRRGSVGAVDYPVSIGWAPGRDDHARHVGQFVDSAGQSGGPGTDHDGWAAADWVYCRDGRWRHVEPGTQPLADGIPGRVGLLRGYGNAIVPQLAAEFLVAVKEVT